MIFSFLLAAGSIAGLWLVSRNPRAGWAWCLLMEIPWTLYAVLVGEYGLAFLCLFYGFVYAYNLKKSKSNLNSKGTTRNEQENHTCSCCEPCCA